MPRRDLWIENDSSALVIASEGFLRARDNAFVEDEKAWAASLAKGECWTVDAAECATVVRVVIGEALDPAEEAAVLEWHEGGLKLPDGRLAISGGFCVGADLDDSDDYVRMLDLEPGAYKARLGLLVGSARAEEIDEESLQEYWKRTRSKRLPAWLKDEDQLFVDFVLHLTPVTRVPKGPKAGAYLDWGARYQKPAKCPDPVLAVEPEGWHAEEPYVQTDLEYIHDVPTLVAGLELAKVGEGPVSIPVKDIVLPYWIAWAAAETHPCVIVRERRKWPVEWPGFANGIKETKTSDGWRIDIEGSNARWSQFGHLRQVGALLAKLPDGARVELMTADAEAETQNGFMRFEGPVTGGVWTIEQTSPEMAAVVLSGMLDLAREAEAGTKFTLLSPEEGERVLEACNARDFLLRENPPTVRGLTASLPKKHAELAPFLFARIFAERFRSLIPLQERDDDLGAWDDAMDVIAEVGAAWATGGTILEGSFAKFTRGELTFDPPELLVFEDDLQALGFQLLGDLNSTQTFAACFRGWANPAAGVYAAFVTNGMGSAEYDFYTRFEDGWSLTTSKADGSGEESSKRLSAIKVTDSGMTGERFRLHLAKVGDLAAEHGAPVEVDPTLAGFAAALDEFMARTMGVASGA